MYKDINVSKEKIIEMITINGFPGLLTVKNDNHFIIRLSQGEIINIYFKKNNLTSFLAQGKKIQFGNHFIESIIKQINFEKEMIESKKRYEYFIKGDKNEFNTR